MIGESLRRDGGYEYDINQFYQINYNATHGLAYYHDEGGNLLFADGHVAHYTQKTLTRDQFDRRR